MTETIFSTKILVKEGFKVMVYCTDNPLLAKKLEDCGASARIHYFPLVLVLDFRIQKIFH